MDICYLPAELLKSGGKPMVCGLHTVQYHSFRPGMGCGLPSLGGERGLVGLRQSSWLYTAQNTRQDVHSDQVVKRSIGLAAGAKNLLDKGIW